MLNLEGKPLTVRAEHGIERLSELRQGTAVQDRIAQTVPLGEAEDALPVRADVSGWDEPLQGEVALLVAIADKDARVAPLGNTGDMPAVCTESPMVMPQTIIGPVALPAHEDVPLSLQVGSDGDVVAVRAEHRSHGPGPCLEVGLAVHKERRARPDGPVSGPRRDQPFVDCVAGTHQRLDHLHAAEVIATFLQWRVGRALGDTVRSDLGRRGLR